MAAITGRAFRASTASSTLSWARNRPAASAVPKPCHAASNDAAVSLGSVVCSRAIASTTRSSAVRERSADGVVVTTRDGSHERRDTNERCHPGTVNSDSS